MAINTQGRAHFFGPNGEQRIFEDGEEVPKGWRDHPFEKAKHPFDGDGDGEPGGGASGGDKDELRDLRAEYQKVVGKRPYNGWDADTLREKIAAA